jgi:apolipoprotein N-acyltransferase
MLCAGAVQAMTFAPGPLPAWSLAALQVIALAFLVHGIAAAPDWRRAWWAGWLFNTACYSLGLYWIYISLHTYGGLASPLAVAAVLALSAFLAIFPATAGPLARWLASPLRGVAGAVAFATCWTALEWVRGTLWTGFPWLNIGYSHVDSVYAGWAPLVGVYGVAWLAAFAAAALAGLWRLPRAAQAVDRGGRRRGLPVVLALLLAVAGLFAARVDWSHPAGAPLQVRLVQGNIEQSEKFDPALMERGLIQHMNQAAQPPAPGQPKPDLIVLPETVLPVFQDQLDPKVWNIWRRIAQERDTTIVMGVPLHRVVGGEDRLTNSAIGFDGATSEELLRNGETAMRYDKQHLVPWGEFIPPGFHWLIDMLEIPMGDFNRGERWQPPFHIRDQYVALDICYEDLFGEELLPSIHPGPQGTPGATILANISNLGWFGDSWALWQHLQIARMRTLETARPLMAATNTGITALIDAHGVVTDTLPALRPGTLAVSVQGMTGMTPYVRMGNWLMLAIMALLAAALAVRRRR